mmetsp:Transcript_24721/g.55472  ORF Transcript_24721/g.55472 Transcript_24721/m.55472 type:complete len:226 (-) Transcript_24721:936-1613(-)
MVSLVSWRGGSRKVSRPIMCHSSLSSVLATARARMPLEPREVTSDSHLAAISSSLHSFSSTWGAPLVVLKVLPVLRSRRVPSVRFTMGSKGMNACWTTASIEGMSTAVRVSVSSASLGGSFHLAAMAAYRSRVYCVSPCLYTGVSFWICILFIVRVPVLSEHRMDIPAMSSMAARRVTMAPSCESSFEPRARVVVVTISIAMGMEATMSTTVKDRASVKEVRVSR